MLQFFVDRPMVPVMLIALLISTIWLSGFADDLKRKWYVPVLANMLTMTIAFLSCYGLAELENLIASSNQSNIRMFGSVLEFPFLTLLLSKIIRADYKVVSDIFAFPYVITMFFGRIPCFVNGCCIGKLIPGTTFRFPIRETEMVICFIYSCYIVFRLLRRKRVYTGRLLPIFMLIYGGYRLFAEFIREPDILHFGMFDLAQVWALLSIVIGTVFLFLLRGKEPVVIKNRKNSPKG